MEAHVLRAALSAAIRVTVSSALVGCGGTTVGDPAGAGHSEPSTSEQPEPYYPPAAASGGMATSYPPSTPAPQNSAGAYPPATAGTSPAGGTATAEGGAPTAAGGAPTTAEEPESFCESPAMQACEPIFDDLVEDPPLWSDPLEPEALACCEALVGALDLSDPLGLDLQCRDQLDQRLNAVRFPCCPALDFQGQACTPWGPPVPPELDLEQLLAWSAAA